MEHVEEDEEGYNYVFFLGGAYPTINPTGPNLSHGPRPVGLVPVWGGLGPGLPPPSADH